MEVLDTEVTYDYGSGWGWGRGHSTTTYSEYDYEVGTLSTLFMTKQINSWFGKAQALGLWMIILRRAIKESHNMWNRS